MSKGVPQARKLPGPETRHNLAAVQGKKSSWSFSKSEKGCLKKSLKRRGSSKSSDQDMAKKEASPDVRGPENLKLKGQSRMVYNGGTSNERRIASGTYPVQSAKIPLQIRSCPLSRPLDERGNRKWWKNSGGERTPKK